MAHVEFNTVFLNLNEEQQTDLKQWRRNVNGKGNDEQIGLWVYGNRFSGSSYVARCALHKMVVEHRDWDWEYFKSIEVMSAMRNLWSLQRQLGERTDPEMLQEHFLIDDEFRYLWDKAHVVLLDDLYDSLDMRFWRDHVHDNIDRRVKEKRPTIIATNMAPNHRVFADVQRVIEGLFVVVRATR
jgi:hypothetical protein